MMTERTSAGDISRADAMAASMRDTPHCVAGTSEKVKLVMLQDLPEEAL